MKPNQVYTNGRLTSEYYFIEADRLHREDGPAVIHYFTNGEISHDYYYLNGKNYDRIDFIVIALNKILHLHGYHMYFEKPLYYVLDSDDNCLIKSDWNDLEESIMSLTYERSN